MAIVINGSGSITGLSAGGLPDGSVDSDTLATGIDATKLADGTVTSTELQYINSLSSNAQTQIDGVGGGKVLSYATVNVNTVSSYTMLNTNNNYSNHGLDEAGVDLTPLNISLTPSATSSKILIIATLFLGIPYQSYGVMRLKRGIGTTASLSGSYDFMNDGTSLVGSQTQRGSIKSVSFSRDSQDTQHFTFTDSPGTISAVNYVFNMRMEADAGTTMWLNRNEYSQNDYGSFAGVSSVTLLELGI